MGDEAFVENPKPIRSWPAMVLLSGVTFVQTPMPRPIICQEWEQLEPHFEVGDVFDQIVPYLVEVEGESPDYRLPEVAAFAARGFKRINRWAPKT